MGFFLTLEVSQVLGHSVRFFSLNWPGAANSKFV